MAQEKSQLRLNIQVNTLKEHEFTAQLYFSIKPIPELNMKSYRSAPTTAIVNPRVETKITSCFKSYLFEATRNELRTLFSNEVSIELWHSDRIKKDVMLGVAKLPLSNIMQQPVMKSKEAYVLSYDVWLPVDEVDEEMRPVRKIAAIRAVAYLEDLGPVTQLKDRGFDVRNLLDEEELQPSPENQYINNPLPSEKNYTGLDDQKRLQLNQLEHQVVWELESWKKAEQARTRLVLKQKETDFWAGLSEQQKKSDLEKEKSFKKVEANLLLLQNKLKAKMNDLIKREQKLVVMENQLQSKINQISREVFLKDEEIQRLKRKHKEEKTQTIKEKSVVELELAKFRAQNARLKVELQEALKQDEKGPINVLKNELTHKNNEIKMLTKQLQNCMETKQQFKQSYEKMKLEAIQRASRLAQKTDQLIGANNEISLMKRDIKHLQQKLVYLKEQQFYANNYGGRHDMTGHDYEQGNMEFNNEREKLIYTRQQLLREGNYNANDPLIREMDKKIAILSG